MPAFVQTNLSLAVDSTAIAGFANRVSVEASAEAKDVTTLNAAGFRLQMAGLRQQMIQIDGFQDYSTTDAIGQRFPLSAIGSQGIWTLGVHANSGAVAGDPAFFGRGRLLAHKPFGGSVGDPAAMSAGFSGDARVIGGIVLHPEAARTASGSGTAVAFTAPTATQTLFASFHVLSVTGAGTLTLNVQTDDNAGMTTPTTRIASSGFTAVGSQFSSLAGALTGETHIRATWTVSGFTSVTFIVAAGVAL